MTRFDYGLQSQGRSGTFPLRVCVSTLTVNPVREQPWKQLPPRNVREEQMLRALFMQSEGGSTCLPRVIKGVGCVEPPLGTAASTCVCKLRGNRARTLHLRTHPPRRGSGKRGGDPPPTVVPCVRLNFTCQRGQAVVPSSVVQCKSRCCQEGIFFFKCD